MAKKQWRRQDEPPEPGPACEIIRLKGTARRHFYCLSPKVWGVWTHWDGRRSVPCTGESKEDCTGHEKQWPLRWKGYLCVFETFKGKIGFLEVTPAMSKMIKGQVPADQGWRGLVLICYRTSEAKGSHCRIEVQPYVSDPSVLAPERDPQQYLEQLWKQ